MEKLGGVKQVKKQIIRVIRNDIVLLILGVLIGFSALLLVHLLPTGRMRENVYWSLGMIEKEFTDETLIEGYNATLTGNFTDCLMLEYAVYDAKNHSLLEQVMRMYRSETYAGEENGWWPGHSLKDYLEYVPQAREVEYSRYWHGYLVVLKPLLFLTSFNAIRLLNSAVQLLLAGCVVISFCKKDASSLAMGFLISLPFLFFVSTYASLSLSICYYIMVISLLLQLKEDSRLFQKGFYPEFFLIVGMATSYFDFLTYPLITLAFPLGVYLYFHEEAIGDAVRRLLSYSAQWSLGYIGMWGAKWVLSDLLTGSETVSDAINTLLVRTKSAEGLSKLQGFFSVIKKNIQPYNNWCYVILGGVLLLLLFKMKKRKIRPQDISAMIPYVILALYPFAWFFVAQNHSAEHWQYTCRIISCSIFAIYAGFAERAAVKVTP